MVEDYEEHACGAEEEGERVELRVGYHFGGCLLVEGVSEVFLPERTSLADGVSI